MSVLGRLRGSYTLLSRSDEDQDQDAHKKEGRELAQTPQLDHDSDDVEAAIPVSDQSIRCSRLALVLAGFFCIIFGYLTARLVESRSMNHTDPQLCRDVAFRREWRSLSNDQKVDFISAVRCLASAPSKQIPDDSLYDDFAYVHTDTGRDSYDSAAFLPYHRYLLYVYERQLKDVCGYNGNLPYWDWTLDWQDLAASPVFTNTSGLGSISGIDSPCVNDGPLNDLSLPYYDGEYPNCIWRALPVHRVAQNSSKQVLSEDSLSPAAVDKLLLQNTYDEFLLELQKNAKVYIPNGIKGNFMEFTAPNDPLFFLHHGQLDRVWWQWQQDRSYQRLLEYSANGDEGKQTRYLSDVISLGVLANNVSVQEVMDTEAGFLCYRY
ncbi:hypothetical protein BKA67DRAFT_652674 [Truncatella angustata]|uniref:Tyrosinase copper-binding domain-containing protein n=1 Tax=Truncatella angustata TaxID=152316 RepID=A0A9P8UWG6_9PEZI|nr:uncharacterized protein BKA67DRAFT_652674 [Truncatella angustata]KAH6659445.1 hypothetical protein BKA67DRAFT_652674 [Truncatella angustata]